MKKIFIIGLITLLMFPAAAQKKSKWGEVNIKVSTQCGMCKDRIEGTLAFEKGVKSSEVDLEKDEVKVIYNVKKTNPGNIRIAISKVGHDADDIPADPKAYAKLPGCCKKPGDPDHVPHD
jgi:periplasmic mercuric ion binding protein